MPAVLAASPAPTTPQITDDGHGIREADLAIVAERSGSLRFDASNYMNTS